MNRRNYTEELTFSEFLLRKALHLNPSETIDTAIVLGTGWAEAFPFKAQHSIKMSSLGGPFELLKQIEDTDSLEEQATLQGHKRIYEIGTVGGHRIIVLRGRLHMNEFTFDPIGKLAVRAQIEVLLRLGVKNLVLTTGCGGLREDVPTGSVVLINGWASSWGEEMPLFRGEFIGPRDSIAVDLFNKIIAANLHVNMVKGGHVFWRGPHFEDLKYDKQLMRQTGAICVSMSVKPEAAVAALFPGVRTIPMGFITNGPSEKMDDDHHRAVAKAAADTLGLLLANIVHILHS